MVRTIYNKGARKEYALMEKLRKQGYDIVVRSAGSHSPIDIMGIRLSDKSIVFIQSKRTLDKHMSYINDTLKNKLESEHQYLNGLFSCSFVVM